jgi:hypothetical protein
MMRELSSEEVARMNEEMIEFFKKKLDEENGTYIYNLLLALKQILDK